MIVSVCEKLKFIVLLHQWLVLVPDVCVYKSPIAVSFAVWEILLVDKSAVNLFQHRLKLPGCFLLLLRHLSLCCLKCMQVRSLPSLQLKLHLISFCNVLSLFSGLASLCLFQSLASLAYFSEV